MVKENVLSHLEVFPLMVGYFSKTKKILFEFFVSHRRFNKIGNPKVLDRSKKKKEKYKIQSNPCEKRKFK